MEIFAQPFGPRKRLPSFSAEFFIYFFKNNIKIKSKAGRTISVVLLQIGIESPPIKPNLKVGRYFVLFIEDIRSLGTLNRSCC